MRYDVTESKRTFAEEFAALEERMRALPPDRQDDKIALLNIKAALKLGYLYGRSEMGKEMTSILKPKAAEPAPYRHGDDRLMF